MRPGAGLAIWEKRYLLLLTGFEQRNVQTAAHSLYKPSQPGSLQHLVLVPH